jgi:hypothetical protein
VVPHPREDTVSLSGRPRPPDNTAHCGTAPFARFAVQSGYALLTPRIRRQPLIPLLPANPDVGKRHQSRIAAPPVSAGPTSQKSPSAISSRACPAAWPTPRHPRTLTMSRHPIFSTAAKPFNWPKLITGSPIPSAAAPLYQFIRALTETPGS